MVGLWHCFPNITSNPSWDHIFFPSHDLKKNLARERT